MKKNSSSSRLARQAREIIAQILLTEVADPRLSMVTVTSCEVAIDRSLCRVYIAAAPEDYDEVLEGLNSAKGRIRSLFGHAIDWRVTPELEFKIDTTTDEAMRITEALKNVPPTMAVEKDEFGYPLDWAQDVDEGAAQPGDGEEDADPQPAAEPGEED